LLVNDLNLRELNSMLAASFLILLAGIKDDMVGLSARKKLIIQVLSALIIIIWADIRLTNLGGFLGVWEISYFWSLTITLLTIVGLTNCFNLVDGIDGLASGLGILSLLSLGFWFKFIGENELMMLSFILVGALMGFVPFNIFGKGNKIFMGDTGSLTIGFIISYLIIKFNQINSNPDLSSINLLRAAPAISIAVVFVPLFDTLRVFVLRLYQRKSPFSPDKIHSHHTLLALGLNHVKTSLFLIFVNAGFILLAFSLSYLGTTILLSLLLLSGFIIFYLPCILLRKRDKKPVFTLFS